MRISADAAIDAQQMEESLGLTVQALQAEFETLAEQAFVDKNQQADTGGVDIIDPRHVDAQVFF